MKFTSPLSDSVRRRRQPEALAPGKGVSLFSISVLRTQTPPEFDDLTNYQKEALIGLRAYFRRFTYLTAFGKVKKTYNARLMFKQGLKNCNYLIHLFYLFSDYCISIPKIKS
jgi:hypothetical protein